MTVCEWPIKYAPLCDSIQNMNPDEKVLIEQAAAEFLWNVTGGVFGVCPVDIRPCSALCYTDASTFWGRGPYSKGMSTWRPVLILGEMYNLTCGCVVGGCRCALDGPTALRLPGPVESIIEVKQDGVILPASSYRVDYGRILIRTDGGVWPACQDLLAESTEENTFRVAYMKGVPVPIGGQYAAGLLACEMGKAACGDKSCQLPQHVQTITRQGMTVGFLDTFEGLAEGKTGLWGVDSWVASVNQPKPYASVRSVDLPQPQRMYDR